MALVINLFAGPGVGKSTTAAKVFAELKMKGIKRIQAELDNLMNDQNIDNCFGVDYWDPDSDNPDVKHWQITLIPPKGTDYEGGYFKIEVKFDETYPDKPPKMKFVTKIYHCNISEGDGHICLNSLKGSWKPTMTIEDILKHIVILLYNASDNTTKIISSKSIEWRWVLCYGNYKIETEFKSPSSLNNVNVGTVEMTLSLIPLLF